MTDETTLLKRIIVNPQIFGGKPIIRGRRLAVEHILAMLAAGDNSETILQGYPWLEMEDIQACLVYAKRLVGREREVLRKYEKALQQGALITVEPGRIRIRLPEEKEDQSST